MDELHKSFNAGYKCWDTYPNTSEQSPPTPSPPPPAMLSFDDQRHIFTRKTIYLHLSTLYWGEGGLRSNCALKNNYSSTR